jgi:hypothetical protein
MIQENMSLKVIINKNWNTSFEQLLTAVDGFVQKLRA